MGVSNSVGVVLLLGADIATTGDSGGVGGKCIRGPSSDVWTVILEDGENGGDSGAEVSEGIYWS